MVTTATKEIYVSLIPTLLMDSTKLTALALSAGHGKRLHCVEKSCEKFKFVTCSEVRSCK